MIPSAASDPASSETASFRAWSAVVIVTILNIYAFVDRAILSLLVQPIKTDLELSDTQMGLLLGAAFVLFYSIANVPAGYIIDRFNRRAIVAVSCFCWSRSRRRSPNGAPLPSKSRTLSLECGAGSERRIA